MQRFLCTLLLFLPLTLLAQITGTVRGTIVEAESQFPVPLATVELQVDSTLYQLTSGIDGTFEFEDIAVGRHTLTVNLMGFSHYERSNVIVNSGKETILQVELQASIMEVGTAEIGATKNPTEVMNEMATVSARAFTVAETDRYAGSRGDPARMASNFAGVQGADDSRNDIVVRGNSPQGVLWRVEGVDIPNPNHFAIPGTAGGPVAILNNKFLSNSDFFTGAFPAEFGNSTAGVFDLRLRNGNRNTHEFSAQFGFLGTELLAEGPLSKSKGHSYLGMYRYSTVEMFSALGIDIGTSAVPKYQDAAFKVNLMGKSGSTLALWGMGGKSSVDILISNQLSPERNIFGENDRDQYFRSQMGLMGATWSKPFNANTYLRTTLAHGIDVQDSYHEQVFRHLKPDNTYKVDSILPIMTYRFVQQKTTLSSALNKKFNRKLSLRTGGSVDLYGWQFTDSIADRVEGTATWGQWQRRWDANEVSAMVQAFAQLKWRPAERLTLVAGWHAQALTLNNSISPFEPRLGGTFTINKKQRLSFGLGQHSQMQPGYMYFYGNQEDENGELIAHNRDMGFSRSRHAVLGYDIQLSSKLSAKAEVYYQQLYDIPVTAVASSFSMINAGSGFARQFPDRLENSGSGRNYGLEMTLVRSFDKGLFFMLTGSVFNALYTGSDGVERNVEFNGKYAWNALTSKEWKLSEGTSFVSGIKLTGLGGRWYGEVDEEASNSAREIVWVDSTRNSLQFAPYFRADVKLNFKFNREKATHEVGIDLVNVTGRKNLLKLTYAPDESGEGQSSIREEYQLGFLPVFFYRIDF